MPNKRPFHLNQICCAIASTELVFVTLFTQENKPVKRHLRLVIILQTHGNIIIRTHKSFTLLGMLMSNYFSNKMLNSTTTTTTTTAILCSSKIKKLITYLSFRREMTVF